MTKSPVTQLTIVVMRTIQMTLGDDLVKEVDTIVNELDTTRSAFTRNALQKAVEQYHNHHLELEHRQGYLTQAVNKEEFSVWEGEQNWGDE